MSGQIGALEAIDRNLRDRAERAARYGKKADKEAARRGSRNPAGDRKADLERFLLEQLSAARPAIAELIEKADAALATLGKYAVKIDGEFGDCLELEQLLANGEEPEYAALRDALARVKGASA